MTPAEVGPIPQLKDPLLPRPNFEQAVPQNPPEIACEGKFWVAESSADPI
jgi:hypothetical protein